MQWQTFLLAEARHIAQLDENLVEKRSEKEPVNIRSVIL